MGFKTKWKFALQGARLVRQRRPVVSGQQALVTCNHGQRDFLGTLSALDIETGEVRWQFNTDHLLNDPYVATNGDIFITCFDGAAYRLNADGALIWKSQPSEGNIWAGTIVGDKFCYAEIGGGSQYTRALNVNDGSLAWQYDNGGHSYTLASDATGRLVHATLVSIRFGESATYLHCIDSDSGEELWKTEYPVSLFRPLIIGKHIYIGSWGHVCLFDLESGALLATYQLGADVTVQATPVDTGKGVVFVTEDGQLFCLGVKQQKKGLLSKAGYQFEYLWSHNLAAEIHANVMLHEGRLHVILESGYLANIDAESGEIAEPQKLTGFKKGFGLAAYQNDLVMSVSKQCTRLAPKS